MVLTESQFGGVGLQPDFIKELLHSLDLNGVGRPAKLATGFDVFSGFYHFINFGAAEQGQRPLEPALRASAAELKVMGEVA